MIEFIAFIFASAFGFGLAFWIASTVLNNSNNYGDYHADAEHYSARVHFTADETLKSGDKRERYSGLSGYKKSTFSLAPKGKGLVQNGPEAADSGGCSCECSEEKRSFCFPAIFPRRIMEKTDEEGGI